MRRYIRSYRTRKNIIRQSALRDQFMQQLSREAEALLKQLNEQFTQQLQTQVTLALRSIVAGDQQVATPTGTGQPEAGTIAGVGQLLSTGIRYLVSRPRTSRTSQETSRSIDAASQFRLSKAQELAEMQAKMATGEKNV